MAFLSSLDIVGSALTAEKYRTDIIMQNMANAKTTKTESGGAYKRKLAVFEERSLNFNDELNRAKGGVRISEVVESDRDMRRVYEPSNPEADEEGYVTYPNVDTTEEMIDLMAASNAYEANLTVYTLMKAMIGKTLEMSK